MALIAIFAYFFLLFSVGFIYKKKGQNSDDYFLAGRTLPLSLAVPSMVATWFGAGSCLGVAAAVYSGGMREVIADPFGTSLSLVLCALFFAIPLRKRKGTTINGILREAYGEVMETFSSLLTLPFYIGTLAAQFLAIGTIMSQLLDMPLAWCVISAGIVVLMYTGMGGLWAVVVTDGIQLGFLVLSLLVLAWPIYTDLGMLSHCGKEFLSEFSSLKPQASFGYWGQWLMTGFGAIMGQDLIQRVLACKDEKTAFRSTLSAGFLYLFLGMIPIFLGFYGRTLWQDLENTNQLVPMLAQSFQSPYVYILFLIGILSITMSTADSYLFSGTSVVMHNLLRSHNLKAARFVNVGMGVLAISVALWIQSIYAIMVHSGVFLFVAVFVPVTGALYLKRTFPFAGWVSVFTGLAAWMIYLTLNRDADNFDELLYASSLVGMLTGALFYTVFHTLLRRLSRPISVALK